MNQFSTPITSATQCWLTSSRFGGISDSSFPAADDVLNRRSALDRRHPRRNTPHHHHTLMSSLTMGNSSDRRRRASVELVPHLFDAEHPLDVQLTSTPTVSRSGHDMPFDTPTARRVSLRATVDRGSPRVPVGQVRGRKSMGRLEVVAGVVGDGEQRRLGPVLRDSQQFAHFRRGRRGGSWSTPNRVLEHARRA